jgi:transglutaminase-like putative cysteine protease
MYLEIRHITEYHYATSVRESVMELWMQPKRSGLQRLIRFDLALDPTAQLFSYADPFGNAVHHFDVPKPHDRLTIEARSTVETQAPPALPEALALEEWSRLSSDQVKGECFDFLRPHGFGTPTAALKVFIARHSLDDLRNSDPLSAVLSLSKTIYQQFEYQPGVTDAESLIDKALEAGRGVCQDFAHIMIAICRGWGIPARYVSGYLLTNKDESRDRSDPDASHAWVEVYLPSIGWVGIDPTNDSLAGERHIIVAIGRDYSDVPPSHGVFKGETQSQLAVGVSVRQAQSAVHEPEHLRLQKPAFPPPGRRRQTTSNLLHDQQQQQQQQQ